MAASQPPWPREWLMTDERIGDQLWEAIEALPPGAGMVFRHYATPDEERVSLGRRIAGHCRRRGLVLAVARDAELARELGAQLVHNPAFDPCSLHVSRSAHSLEEAKAACETGTSLLFVSPVFPTRSHPGRPALGQEEAVRIARACPTPAIALGGMDLARFHKLEAADPRAFHGYAGIDCWLGE